MLWPSGCNQLKGVFDNMSCLFIVFIVLSLTRISFSQQKFNPSLKKKLDSIFVLDQKYREAITYLAIPREKTQSLKFIHDYR
jgi:hypothetical protein